MQSSRLAREAQNRRRGWREAQQANVPAATDRVQGQNAHSWERFNRLLQPKDWK